MPTARMHDDTTLGRDGARRRTGRPAPGQHHRDRGRGRRADARLGRRPEPRPHPRHRPGRRRLPGGHRRLRGPPDRPPQARHPDRGRRRRRPARHRRRGRRRPVRLLRLLLARPGRAATRAAHRPAHRAGDGRLPATGRPIRGDADGHRGSPTRWRWPIGTDRRSPPAEVRVGDWDTAEFTPRHPTRPSSTSRSTSPCRTSTSARPWTGSASRGSRSPARTTTSPTVRSGATSTSRSPSHCAAHRDELAVAGWTVELVPDTDHMSAMQAANVAPILIPWLTANAEP